MCKNTGISRQFLGVVRTAVHLPVPWYSDDSIFSNSLLLKTINLQNTETVEVEIASNGALQLYTIEFHLPSCLRQWMR